MRKCNTDLNVTEDSVIVTVDITGIMPDELYVGISEKFNSLILKYNEHIRDIPITVKVLNDFEHIINNGVLIVTVKRLKV